MSIRKAAVPKDQAAAHKGGFMEHEQILRINELAKKKKTVGLTAEEAEEQAALRKQYIAEYRANVEAQLKNVLVEQEDGSYKPLVKH